MDVKRQLKREKKRVKTLKTCGNRKKSFSSDFNLKKEEPVEELKNL